MKRKEETRHCMTCGLALPKRKRPHHPTCSVCRKVAAGHIGDSAWDSSIQRYKALTNRDKRIKALKGHVA